MISATRATPTVQAVDLMMRFAVRRLGWDATLEGSLEVLPVRMASDHRLLHVKLAAGKPRRAPSA
jgi:hypothetical protein